MALDGILIVDLTHVVAGPMATKVLRDLGARVIKVEPPQHHSKPPGDVTRFFQPLLDDGGPVRSAYFASLNSGKESVVLELDPSYKAAERDRPFFETLLCSADVLVENFRPGVLEKLGYSWESLHSKHPQLVVASLSGFGQTGPYSHRKAVDTIIQGMSGFISTTGFDEKPVKVGTTVSDLLAGVYCATGVLAALHKRDRHGIGCRVDVAMLDTSFAFHAREFANYHVRQREPPRLGNISPIGVYPFDVFECKGNELFAVNASSDRDFALFCKILGCPEMAQDLRFSTNKQRWVHVLELRELINSHTRQWKREALLKRMLEITGSNSFPVGPVNTMGDLNLDPQINHRGMVHRTEDGRFVIIGNPIKITSGDHEMTSERAPNPPALDADGPRLRQEFAQSSIRRQSKL